MKLYKTVLLSSLIGFATFVQATALDPEYSVTSNAIGMSFAPTEDVEEDEQEEAQADCILWPGCIVTPSRQTIHK